MTKVTVAGMSVLGTLAVALVLGTQYLEGDPEGSTVVTVLGLLGLGVSQLLGHRETARGAEKTEELSKDLRNGTFERLLRESLEKLANENGVPLEISKEDPETHASGTGAGDIDEGSVRNEW